MPAPWIGSTLNRNARRWLDQNASMGIYNPITGLTEGVYLFGLWDSNTHEYVSLVLIGVWDATNQRIANLR